MLWVCFRIDSQFPPDDSISVANKILDTKLYLYSSFQWTRQILIYFVLTIQGYSDNSYSSGTAKCMHCACSPQKVLWVKGFREHPAHNVPCIVLIHLVLTKVSTQYNWLLLRVVPEIILGLPTATQEVKTTVSHYKWFLTKCICNHCCLGRETPKPVPQTYI